MSRNEERAERIEQLARRVTQRSEELRAWALALQDLSEAPAERLLRLLRRADQTWHDEEKVDRWVLSTRGILGGRTPAELALSGEDGLRQALMIIEQIDHGIFS